MKFTPGTSGNPTGRPKGSKNKTTETLRQFYIDFLHNNLPKIQAKFDTLDPKDQLSFIEKASAFALPKLQATTLTANFEQMSDEQLDKIIESLKQQIQ